MTIVAATKEAIQNAASRLKEGKLVAFPTETVYGLGADATNDHAIAAVFEAKGRPRFNPLIIHVASTEKAFEIGRFNEASQTLSKRFWPGPLTLVVPRKEGSALSTLTSAGLETIAIRLPAKAIARELIAQAGVPVAAPSANPSGRISPTRADHVEREFGPSMMVLDGGPCETGLESSVVFADGDRIALLRKGALSRHEIEAVVGPIASKNDPKTVLRSPGQLERHYAPRHALRLNASYVEQDEALMAFGTPLEGSPVAMRNLSATGDLTEAAANLFACLRELDDQAITRIAVMPIPDSGLGEAINDRLQRAAR